MARGERQVLLRRQAGGENGGSAQGLFFKRQHSRIEEDEKRLRADRYSRANQENGYHSADGYAEINAVVSAQEPTLNPELYPTR